MLKFIRQKDTFQEQKCETGFYQDSGEGLLLLRIQLNTNAQYYPTVSGNKFRYSIRFMLPCAENSPRYISDLVSFHLARC